MEERIDTQELLEKTKECKQYSGPILTRIFWKTGIPGYELGPLGSAGFLKYENKYFVVTAHHVVSSIDLSSRLNEVVIPFITKDGTEILNISNHAEDKDNDIVAFEIEPNSAKLLEAKSSKNFLDYTLFDEQPLSYNKNLSNIVFLHGIAGQETNIDYEALTVEMTTTPYTTFIKEVDDASGMITLFADKTGTNEFGLEGHELPEFNGMSGSFAYSYRRGSDNPFRLLGVLTNGNRDAGFMYVLPITDVENFIKKEFFE